VVPAHRSIRDAGHARASLGEKGNGALYNRVEFLAVEATARDWFLEVRIHGIVVGRIRREPSSKTYGYYRITDKGDVPFHEGADLEALLQRVSRNP
jgi:hypothetical protein